MTLQSNAYREGRAKGILESVELLNPEFSNEQLANAYAEKLKDLGYSEEKATYWRNYFFSEEGSIKTFIELFKESKVNVEDIDEYIDSWHSSRSKLELHECLGMTWEEYSEWVKLNKLNLRDS